MKKIFAITSIIVFLFLLAGCAGTMIATPLVRAAREGNNKAIIELLNSGGDVNEPTGWPRPLVEAARFGHIDTVRLLIDRGADVNAIDAYGLSPLNGAAINAHVDVARLLVEKGADIDSAIAGLGIYNGANGGNAAVGIAVLERLAQHENKSAPPVVAKSSSDSSDSSPVKSDIDEPPAIKSRPNKDAYAIVIGIEQYRQKLPKADFATQDAMLVSDYLIKALGYPEENVVTITNDRAALGDFVKYFEKWLPNNVEKNNTVFVYYSGHGAPNPRTGDAYLVPYDGDPSFIDQTGYSLKRMYDALGKLPAKEVIVALDSCFSGAGGRSVLAEGARPLVMNLQKSFVVPMNMTVLAAAAGDQISSTYKDKGHGLFTYFLLKGIKNEDVVNSDGSIEISALYNYIKPQVERIARKQYNNEQTPQLISPKKTN